MVVCRQLTFRGISRESSVTLDTAPSEGAAPTASGGKTRWDKDHPSYKWVALSNTTLGTLMATINGSIVIISLPAIFRGIGIDPLQQGNVGYLLWMIMGFLLASAVLVVTFGRLGDMFGRVRVYTLGFVVFTVASLALGLDPVSGGGGA
ncbi:MAG: transporter, partial [Blastococcus sp.]|nr:transporter [Blastococcus sp.]